LAVNFNSDWTNTLVYGRVVLDPDNISGGTLAEPGLFFGGGSGEGIASTRTALMGGTNRWGLDFFTDFKRRFSIANNGNIGIANTEPSEKLDIGNGNLLVRGPANFANWTQAWFYLGDTNNYVKASWGGGLRLGVWEGADALAINNGGNVGIGTTSPQTTLDVRGSARVQRLEGQPSEPLEVIVNGLRSLRVEASGDSLLHGAPNLIGGAPNNSIASGVVGATIAGGGATDISWQANSIAANYAAIAGGSANTIETNASFATIGGGGLNTIMTNADYTVIGGGYNNTIMTNARYATIGGGNKNTVAPDAGSATVGGGYENTIATDATSATIGGGYGNMIGAGAHGATIGGGTRNTITSDGPNATIPGGVDNFAAGDFAFAAGCGAEACHYGAFVWADATGEYLSSTGDNSVTMQASGGYRLFSDMDATVGVRLAAGANAFSPMSDRNVKENVRPVDPRSILAKVVALPVTEWNLVSQDPFIRHLGPMAQDFKAAFGLGEDDRHISTSDADGVALAAIQGLNEKMNAETSALRAELKAKDAEIQELRKAVAELGMMIVR
jgi:hypothetical protein